MTDKAQLPEELDKLVADLRSLDGITYEGRMCRQAADAIDALRAAYEDRGREIAELTEQRMQLLDENNILHDANESAERRVAELEAALKLWKIASDNSEECELDDMAHVAIPMPLFHDADEATDEALKGTK